MATKRSPGLMADGQDLRHLREQMARLTAIIERQAADIERQEERIEQQHHQIEQQREQAQQQQATMQAKIDELSQQTSAKVARATASRGRVSGSGRGTSRRALLKWGGAAAAAASVALVASEGQAARAASMAPAADGANLQLGAAANSNNTASTTTTLSVVSSQSVTPVFVVDASNSTATAPVALEGVANVAKGIGVKGSANDSGGYGVYGINSGVEGVGVYGANTNTPSGGYGVYGYTNGASASSFGVSGQNDGSGYGVYGYSKGASGIGVQGSSGAGGTGTLGDASGAGVSGNATLAPGVVATTSDTTNKSPALLATNNGNGVGIIGWGADGQTGVVGQVTGTSTSSIGVGGLTSNGYGVVALSGSGIDLAVGVGGPTPGQGRIQQALQASAGAPTAGTYNAGEQLRDSSGELWLCTVSGSPGTWIRALHVLTGYAGGATVYLSKPIRLLDTRTTPPDSNAWQDGGGPYASGSTHTLQIAGDNWSGWGGVVVPTSAVGAIGKLTVISSSGGSGYVAIVPSGVTPTTGTLPYGANQTIATAFNVGLGGSPGSIDIYVGGTAVDVVIDLFAVVA